MGNDRSYYAGLDGLRGVAIIFVLGYHMFSFLPIFRYGWLGVDLFFVLSGFLITEILLKTKGKKQFLKTFYIRRVLRIVPVYYITIFLFVILLPAVSKVSYDAGYYQHYKWDFWLYVENWLFIFKNPEKTSFLTHFWSLAIEQQFYLVWPWFILIVKSTRKMLFAVLFLLLMVMLARVVCWHFYGSTIGLATFYKFSRVDGLIVGAALAVYMQLYPKMPLSTISKLLAGLMLLNIIFISLNEFLNLQMEYFAFLGYTSFSILFALMLHVIITRQRNMLSGLLNQRPLIMMGRISYGFYVYHWPIYVLFSPLIIRYLHHAFIHANPLVIQFVVALIITGIGIGVSTVSFIFIEKQFLKLKYRVS